MLINPEQIIIAPVVTEKSLINQEKGIYSFWVNVAANKNQIASAFQSVFGVKPLSVNTSNLKGKMKTDWKKRTPIKKSDRKKAIITLGKDQKIELLNIAK